MNIRGLILGDETNRRYITSPMKNVSVNWNTFENQFRAINGDLNRLIIKSHIPSVSFDMDNLSDENLGILLGARAQKQVMYLMMGDGFKVKRQMETLTGLDYLFLTPSSLDGLSEFKVYEKADFDGATDLFYSYDPLTRTVVLNVAMTAGDSVYVDYTATLVKVICTSCSSTPYRGASSNRWSAKVGFEGI